MNKHACAWCAINTALRDLPMAAVQVRNKQVTKHFTEKTVKEIWKDRMAERKSGKATDLCDFICNHFQKKIGIMSAVVEVGTELPCSIIHVL